MKRGLRNITIFSAFWAVSMLLLANAARAECEPFPEELKKHPQVMNCYPLIKTDDGTTVRDWNVSWYITWGMATEWFPNAKEPYIVFVNPKSGKRTTIPFGEGYSCSAG